MRKKLIFLLTSALLSTILNAQPENWKGKTEVKDGITYIHNPEQGLWDNDPGKKLTIEKIFSIGSLNADDEYLFSWVKDITTDSAGNIYACDFKEQRIQVYDKTGKYIRTIGRKGQGPGEFQRPVAVRIDGEGNIFILDDISHRVSSFKQNGKFKTSFQFKRLSSHDLEIDSNGYIFLHHSLYGTKDERYPPPIISEYDLKGNIIQQYGKPKLILEKDVYGRPYYASNSFSKQYNSDLLVSFSYPYLIHLYKYGVLQKAIERDSPIFSKPEIVETVFRATTGEGGKVKSVRQRSYIWNLLPLPGNRFAAFIRDSGKNFKKKSVSGRDFVTILDLFDSDGKFLKSYPWDWQQCGLLEHIDRHGYFYSNRGDSEIVPGITKWKVTLE
jgi:hypothetical protein